MLFQEVATGNLSSPERVFYVADFNDLDEITSQLVSQIETVVLEGKQCQKQNNATSEQPN